MSPRFVPTDHCRHIALRVVQSATYVSHAKGCTLPVLTTAPAKSAVRKYDGSPGSSSEGVQVRARRAHKKSEQNNKPGV